MSATTPADASGATPVFSYPRIAWRALLFWLATLVLLIALATPIRFMRHALRDAGYAIDPITSIAMSDPVLIPIGLAEIAAVLLATRWMMRKGRLDWAEVGLGGRGIGRDLLVGLAIGLVEFGLVPLLAFAGGWVELVPAAPDPGFAARTFLSLAVVVLGLLPAAAFEEIADRGYVFTLLAARSRVVAIAATSLFFAFMHAASDGFNLVAFIEVLLSGIALAVGRIRSRALWLPIGWHFGWNMAQGWLFGAVVSGMRPAANPLFAVRFIGPPLWVGGAFGPESGLLAVAATSITLLAYVRLVPAAAAPAAPPAAPPPYTTTSSPIAS